MKTSFRTIILAAASIFAAMSCQKEESVPGAQNQIKAGETIQININASLGDLVAADGTKATATSVVRLEWAEEDKVDAYYGNDKISGDARITVNPSDNKIFAKLSGTITAPTNTTIGDNGIITFVYSNGCRVEDNLTFDFSTQNTDEIPFVAYATVKYGEIKSGLSDKMVEFKFATSVMKIAATNLGGGEITDVAISGINTKVTLAPIDSGEPTINGGADTSVKDITTTNVEAPSDGTRAIITVGLVPDKNKGRNITVKQANYTNKGVITSDEIESNTSYTTPTALFPCGTLEDHDYVLIAGTKWATQNLAVSASGIVQWKSVTLPGTTTPVQIGDYFQWGAFENYTIEDNSDKGLLIYKEFTNNGSSGSFTWKTGLNAGFSTSSISPYYTSGYKKYTTDDKIVTLTPSDDVASILWSGTWRMPTSAEFLALYDATYWAWDDTDCGYYVFAPDGSHTAGTRESSIPTGLDKGNALLFFPAAGFGDGTGLYDAGSNGIYWSSSLYSSYPDFAYGLCFNSVSVYPQDLYNRYHGFSVRPVSD